MKIKKEFYIGVVAVVTIFGFYFGFNYLDGNDVFSNDRKFFVVYDRIDGLQSSNTVTLNGYKIGLVNTVNLYPGDSLNRILVELRITKDIEIPANTIAEIKSDFLGLNTVALKFVPSDRFAKDGDTLKSSIATSIQDEVANQMKPIKVKTEKMLSSIDSILEAIKYTFNGDAQKALNQSIKRILLTIDNLNHSTETLDNMITDNTGTIKQIINNANSIALNIKNNNDKINNLIDNLSNFSDSLAKVNFAQTLHSVDKALYDLSVVTDKINKGQGTLGQLVNNDTLYFELEKASRDLNLLLEDLKLHPNRYVHISVFGKKAEEYKAPEKK